MAQFPPQQKASRVQQILFIHCESEGTIERHLGDSRRVGTVVNRVLTTIFQPLSPNRVATRKKPKAAYLLFPLVSDLPILTPIATECLADSSDTFGCFKQCSYTCFGSIAT